MISIAQWHKSLSNAQFGLSPVDLTELHPPVAVEAFFAVIAAFRERGLPEDEAGRKAVEFLRSDVPTASPRRRVFGLLYASLGMRAQNGQSRAPNQGMVNDISVIADVLPYCHAMFVDNGARALVDDIPKNRKPLYGGKVFSPNVRDDFWLTWNSL